MPFSEMLLSPLSWAYKQVHEIQQEGKNLPVSPPPNLSRGSLRWAYETVMEGQGRDQMYC